MRSRVIATFENVARSVLPPESRAFLRRASRSAAFGLAAAELRLRGTGRLPRTRTLKWLRYGWGNEAYSSDLSYLDAVARHALSSHGAVVEAGSGVSTVMLSYVLPAGRKLLAYEHIAEWADRVNGAARRGVRPVAVAPLVEREHYAWYDTALEPPPDDIGLVVCDGPPGVTRGGRVGALPLLWRHLQSGAVVLLDDADRDGEQAVLEQWRRDFGVDFEETSGPQRAYAVGRVP